MKHVTDYEVLHANLIDAVRFEIKRAGYSSPYEFCQKTNVPKTTITDCLNGRRDTSLKTVVLVANALGISPIKLLNFMRAEVNYTPPKGNELCVFASSEELANDNL